MSKRKMVGYEHVCCWCKRVFEHDAYPAASLALALGCNTNSPVDECHELICVDCQEKHKRSKCVKHTIRIWINEAKKQGVIS